MKRWTLFFGATIVASILAIYGPGSVERAVAEERGLSFEVYQDAKEEFRWRLKAGNGKIIAVSSEGYKAKADCVKGIELVKTGAASAKVQEAKAK